MEIDALVTDLDGTFWATDMTLHPESVQAVARVDAAGIPFVVATGRRAQSTLAGLGPLSLADRPAILMNGALARDQLEGPSFHRSAVTTEDALRIRDIFVAHDLEPLVYIDDPTEDLLAAPNVSAGETYVGTAPGVRHVQDLAESIAESIVIGFGAFGFAHDHLARLKEGIEAEALASVFISPSHYEGDHGIMVQGRGVDKSTGLDALCERHGIDRNRLAVVGDGFNDIGMLSTAAIAIVPNNAPDEVQALADAIIEPNELGGWKQIPAILGM